MEQTFDDLLRERAEEGGGLGWLALWLFAETTVGVIKEKLMSIALQKKDLTHVALGVGAILAIPLIAMQFSDEVVWTIGDFFIAGILLSGAGLLFKWVTGSVGSMTFRCAVGLSVFSGLLLIWMNLAVGLIGSENNPANLMYLCVLMVGLIGAGRARFQAKGMSSALFSMAIAQGLVAAIALIFGMYKPVNTVAQTLNLNGFFIILFVVSALLFRHAAEQTSTRSAIPDNHQNGGANSAF